MTLGKKKRAEAAAVEAIKPASMVQPSHKNSPRLIAAAPSFGAVAAGLGWGCGLGAGTGSVIRERYDINSLFFCQIPDDYCPMTMTPQPMRAPALPKGCEKSSTF